MFFYSRRLRNRFLKKYQNKFNHHLFTHKKKSPKDTLRMNGHSLTIEKPEYYEDIILQNEHPNRKTYIQKKQSLSILLVIIGNLLYGTALLVFTTLVLKDRYRYTESYLWSIVPIMYCLMVVDPVLSLVVREEHFRLKSDFTYSFMVYSCITKFTSVALIPMSVAFYLRPTYE